MPGRANCVLHNVDVGNAEPIKQNPYRVNPKKLEFLRREVGYMLEHGIIEPSQSNWSSPCLLVSKSDGSYRFCTDYRKVNSVTKSDSYPIPRVEELFCRLKAANLTVNLVKSEFGHAYVTYLGHVVGQGQVRPITAKVDAIIDYSAPTTKRQMMRFLGMAGYYRKFCRDFAALCEPLTNLLRKNVMFVWSDLCQRAFDRVKMLLMSAPVLVMPDFKKPFILTIDASDFGVGAVLLQEDENGIDHPIGYFSHKLSASQRNYSTSEKETLALVLALQHFDFYLTPAQFPVQVYTDHNPLVFLNRMKNKNQRLLRWSLALQSYDLCIKHLPGRRNVLADALSQK